MIGDFVDEDGWLSYNIPPSSHLTADALHDARHRKNARRQFDYMWRNGVSL
jgi:hypothetical protein